MDAIKEHSIVFSGLKDGPHEFSFELGDGFFTAAHDEELEGGSVRMHVHLDKTPTMLVASMRADGAVRLHCDHCNGPMSFPVKGTEQQLFHLNGRDHFDEDDDEVVALDPDQNEINLTHCFYECVRLALPIRRVHPEGQCDPEVDNALKARSVESEHEPDPRWAALNKLKKKTR